MKEKVETWISKLLNLLEILIAIITLIVIIGLLCVEIYQLVSDPSSFLGIDYLDEFLQKILSLVVGLEFVKMLIHLTPETTIEVLIMATSRQIIVTHHDALGTVAGIACIAALFATKRFLIPKKDTEPEKERSDVH